MCNEFPNPPLAIEKRSGIYAFRHRLSGMIYVGQSKDVHKRRGEHERSSSSGSRRFHNAIKAHGASAFEFIVLEYCDLDMLDEREVIWISRLKSIHPNGYNLKSGGGALHEHHSETRAIMSANQKARIESGDHLFASAAFQEKQAIRQRELVQKGVHPSQDPTVRAKRDATVKSRIATDGKFFSHKPETIEEFKVTQRRLYESGKGKFQQPELIELNRQKVRKRLEDGTHFSQSEQWSVKAKNAARAQMRSICIAVRRSDGSTTNHVYESLHAAQEAIGTDRSHLSSMCKDQWSHTMAISNLGLVVKACFGEKPSWDEVALSRTPTSRFLKTMPVLVTIELPDGAVVERDFLSQRAACDELEAQHRAFRWILKGEKYKSTKCKLGRIVKVEEIEPTSVHIEMMIRAFRQ